MISSEQLSKIGHEEEGIDIVDCWCIMRAINADHHVYVIVERNRYSRHGAADVRFGIDDLRARIK